MIDLSKIDYKTGKVTYISYEELKEDMLQVNFPNSLILDLGWYDPEFRIYIIKDYDRENPIAVYSVYDEEHLLNALNEAIDVVSKEQENPLTHSDKDQIESPENKDACLEYSIDGYNLIKKKIYDLAGQLSEIKQQTDHIFTSPFGVDIVVEGEGRMSIGLAENTVLFYKSEDFESQLSAVGNIEAAGESMFYFGDYSIISDKYLISYDSALQAIEFWIKNGELSDDISWTEEIF